MKKLDHNKKTLVLDLDETLIYACYSSEKKSISYDYEFSCMDNTDISVLYRPHLNKFINYVTSNFNIIVWTSAARDYARQIVDEIFDDQTHLIAKEDYSKYHTIRPFHIEDLSTAPSTIKNIFKAIKYWKQFDMNLLDKHLSVKPLRKVLKDYNLNIKDVIAIDNDPYKFYDFYGNYWYIPDFEGDKDDDYLLKFINLLDKLKKIDDIRVNKNKFKHLIK